MLRGLLKSAGICTLLYLPWFAWAWVYYGSPIPQTVLAKLILEQTQTDHLGHPIPSYPVRYFLALGRVFQPAYFDPLDTSWHLGLWEMTTFLGICCAFYWVIPSRDNLGRAASLSFALLCAYFASMALVSVVSAAGCSVDGCDHSPGGRCPGRYWSRRAPARGDVGDRRCAGGTVVSGACFLVYPHVPAKRPWPRK